MSLSITSLLTGRYKKCINILDMNLPTQTCSYGHCSLHSYLAFGGISFICSLEWFPSRHNVVTPQFLLVMSSTKRHHPCLERISFVMFIYDDLAQLQRGSFTMSFFISFNVHCVIHLVINTWTIAIGLNFFLFLNIFKDMRPFSAFSLISDVTKIGKRFPLLHRWF